MPESSGLTADDVLTVREAAALLTMPVSTVSDLARRGEIPSVKLGRRRIIIRRRLQQRIDPKS